MSELINEEVHAICIDQDINAIVPPDAPCVWISRDMSGRTPSSLVDVWTRCPKRMVWEHSVEYIDGGNGESTLLGRFSVVQVIDRFSLVPNGDECICIDNPKVS